ncbi:MAG: chromosomal replication initiator protein DnaA [Pseudomonadota bacterium]
MKALIDDVLDRLKEDFPPQEFQRWLAPLKYDFGNKRVLSIQVPNIFFKSWITDNYLPRIKNILREIAGREVEIDLTCAPADTKADDLEKLTLRTDNNISQNNAEFRSTLIEKYTFDTVGVGNSNQLAHAASLAVANHSVAYNPLFIYGGSGLGKTHLLNAIGNHLASQDPRLKVLYLSSEEFTNQLIEALRTERMSDFRQKYRNIDTLLIDDIHFIGGRERTQEEFFYTFNALHEAERQIVLSSDKMPKEIPDLEERLRSRFEGGLFADISVPDRETKVAILYKKAEEEGIELSHEVAFYLASQTETNIRILEGYLARLGAYSSLTKQPIDLETAQKLFGLFVEAEQKQITIDLILKVSADFFNLKVSDLRSGRKHKIVAGPRQAAMYMARQLTSLSTVEIGQRFGGRDHSTVIHAVKKIESRLEADHGFARTISELKKAIRNSAAQKEYPQA